MFLRDSTFSQKLAAYVLSMQDREAAHSGTTLFSPKDIVRDGGGDGIVYNYPRWWLPTHETFGIYLPHTFRELLLMTPSILEAWKQSLPHKDSRKQ
jgi:hypothetical protein